MQTLLKGSLQSRVEEPLFHPAFRDNILLITNTHKDNRDALKIRASALHEDYS